MTLIGTGAIESRLTAIGNHQGLLKQLALSVVREQKLLVPRKTGNLGRSIHIASITQNSAQIIASANYAAYTEYGTHAHDIVPRTKKALRFAVGAKARLCGSPRKEAGVASATRGRHLATSA